MSADKQIIELFLRGYATKFSITFAEVFHPDELGRNHARVPPAVDAIASDHCGRKFAVEHTLLQPFPNQKHDLCNRLGRVFEPLKHQKISGRSILITVPDNCLKPDQDWARAAAALDDWFEHVKCWLPIGWSIQITPVDGTEVHMVIDCEAVADDQGSVSITYAHPQMAVEFPEVVAEAIRRKIGKLIDANADRRILLFEREWAAYSTQQLSETVESLLSSFPELRRVDEIWLADSYFWRRGTGDLWVHGIWPKGWPGSMLFHTKAEPASTPRAPALR